MPIKPATSSMTPALSFFFFSPMAVNRLFAWLSEVFVGGHGQVVVAFGTGQFIGHGAIHGFNIEFKTRLADAHHFGFHGLFEFWISIELLRVYSHCWRELTDRY
tara:strand:- start:3372 stop:3683 length:312 start_codon:yes stop_codon:yes gene_type:complete